MSSPVNFISPELLTIKLSRNAGRCTGACVHPSSAKKLRLEMLEVKELGLFCME